jgi:hypothetical protein
MRPLFLLANASITLRVLPVPGSDVINVAGLLRINSDVVF